MLTEHFKTHKKDHGSRKGLLTLVAKRRRLLTYLRDTSPERYKAVLEARHPPLVHSSETAILVGSAASDITPNLACDADRVARLPSAAISGPAKPVPVQCQPVPASWRIQCHIQLK